MKNLPEREEFDQLEDRLRQYTEDPDESSWDHIAAALHPNRDKRPAIWFERTTDALAIVLLLFLLWNASNVTHERAPGTSDRTRISNDLNNQNKTKELALIPDSKKATQEKNVPETFSGNPTGNRIVQLPTETHQESIQAGHDGVENFNVPQQPEGKVEMVENIPAQSDSIVAKPIPVDSVASVNENSEEKKKKKKIRKHTQMYFVATPSLAFQKMTPLESDQVVVKGVVPESMMSTNRLGISLEAGFQRNVLKKLDVYGGISYYQQDQKITYEYQETGSVTVEESDKGFAVSPTVEQNEFEYKMRNLGISAGLLYQIKGGKLQHLAGIGLQYHQGMAKAPDESTYDNGSSLYLNYQLSYRMQFQVNKRTYIFLQPNFTHSFYTKEKLDQPFELKPYRAGLGFGLLYSF